jgi:hypothetical protein
MGEPATGNRVVVIIENDDRQRHNAACHNVFLVKILRRQRIIEK